MRGEDGLAAAQWASAVLSVIAISIALYVFLTEQRRDNQARLKEAVRDRQARLAAHQQQIDERNDYVKVCVLVLTDAINILAREIAVMPTSGFSYTDWNEQQGIPRVIKATMKTAEAMRSVSQVNIHLALTMSRAIEVMEDCAIPRGAMPTEGARQIAAKAQTLLTVMRDEVESYFMADVA